MKFLKSICLVLFAALSIVSAGYGQTLVPLDEVETVAASWIQMVTQQQGNWAGSSQAHVIQIQEFKKEELLVGYLCKIHPDGVLVVSKYKELSPVKFYTDKGQFDAGDNEGLPLFLKDYMAMLLKNFEDLAAKLGTAKSNVLQTAMEVDFTPMWNLLLGVSTKSGFDAANYATGDVLLSSNWHQNPPYNDDCPFLGCSNSNGRAIVGCVATAGAQIMRYWNWPPYGSGSPYNDGYDWPNMMDTVTTTSPQAQIDAVAELNHEVGLAVGMDYGCGSSGAPTSDMVGVYENQYRYATACRKIDRDDYSHSGWYAIMKSEFNYNRPVQYRIPDHSIVGDGWRERYVYPSTLYEIHINYGWGGTNSGWFTLYSIPGGNPSEEYMVENIYPAQVLSEWISGTYGRNASF